MPVANYSSYVRSRPRISVPRRIDRLARPQRPAAHPDDALRPLSRRDLPRQPMAAASAIYRSMFGTLARLAGHAGGTLPQLVLAIMSWMVAEILAGCAAYAMAMYGVPLDDRGDPEPSASAGQRLPDQKPGLKLISANTRRGTGELLLPSDAGQPRASARTEYVVRPKGTPNAASSPASAASSAASGYHTAIAAPAVLILSKIRRARARRRTIAELAEFDDRSLRDIGLSRCDIEHVARHGARRE